MFERIPRELRERAQWIVWRYVQKDDAAKPTKPPINANTGWPASVTKPADWATFDVAVNAYHTNKLDGIGYVISPDDPFTFIDLDTYDPKLTDEDRQRHTAIAQTFKGYAEISPSGQGLHLIVAGTVPDGRRRAGVEIYSGERYMTVTGKVWRDEPIVEQQALLSTLWAELGGTDDEPIVSLEHEHEERETDFDICNRANNASNGELFADLYHGRWHGKYSSQSEADFALIDIVAFYTQNRIQIRRIFRASQLGQRDKAKRDKYVDSMINRSFDKLSPKVNFEALLRKMPAPPVTHESPDSNPIKAPHVGLPEAPADEVYALPPGLVGEIAQYVYSSAARPVKEIALVAALGLMSGICGRSYNVSNTGLNHYLLLLAATGSGKESIALGISTIMEQVSKAVPSAMDFIGPAEIRSDVALLKYLSKRSASFVTVGGEFGQTLQQMSAIHAGNQHFKGIKRVMLDLYGKSGRGATLQPTIYSDSEKNTLVLASPSFSFVGESAPEPFYEAIDERMISDGLLPRFTLVEYRGKRPDLNPNAGHDVPKRLVERVASLCAQSLMLNKQGVSIDVEYTPDAKAILDEFDRQCTAYINDGEREVIKHIWNRAHLRALKLAACVAVGVDPFKPIIDLTGAQWAIKVALHNTDSLLKRFEAGEVGHAASDMMQQTRMYRTARMWLTQSYANTTLEKTFPNVPHLHAARIIPGSFMARRLSNDAAFKADRMGATFAIKRCIGIAVEAGVLVEVPKGQLAKAFAYNGKAYAVSDFSQLEKLAR